MRPACLDYAARRIVTLRFAAGELNAYENTLDSLNSVLPSIGFMG